MDLPPLDQRVAALVSAYPNHEVELLTGDDDHHELVARLVEVLHVYAFASAQVDGISVADNIATVLRIVNQLDI